MSQEIFSFEVQMRATVRVGARDEATARQMAEAWVKDTPVDLVLFVREIDIVAVEKAKRFRS